MKKSGKNVRKALLLIVVIVIAAVVCFFALIFSNSSYNAKQYKFSNKIFDKLIEAQKAGSTVKFNSEELNETMTPFIKSDITSGSVAVKGVNAEVEDSTLKFYIPATYKNFKFLVTTEGKVSYKNNNIVYDPLYFKVGKISLPKSYIMSKLAGKLGGDVDVADNKINISSSLIPIKIKSIEIQNDELLLHTDEKTMSIKERLNWFNNIIRHGGNSDTLNKLIQEESSTNTKDSAPFISQVVEQAVNNAPVSSDSDSSSSVKSTAGSTSISSSSKLPAGSKSTAPSSSPSSSSSSKLPVENKSSSKPDNSKNTKSTQSSENTSGKQEVVSQIMAAVNSHDKSALGSIEAKYSKLSPKDQEDVQITVSSMLDSSTLAKIQQEAN